MSDVCFPCSPALLSIRFLAVSMLYEGKKLLRFLFVSTPFPCLLRSFPISCLYTGNGKRNHFRRLSRQPRTAPGNPAHRLHFVGQRGTRIASRRDERSEMLPLAPGVLVKTTQRKEKS
jgi:hypothetical protein